MWLKIALPMAANKIPAVATTTNTSTRLKPWRLEVAWHDKKFLEEKQAVGEDPKPKQEVNLEGFIVVTGLIDRRRFFLPNLNSCKRRRYQHASQRARIISKKP
jgi:hypothetical protein